MATTAPNPLARLGDPITLPDGRTVRRFWKRILTPGTYTLSDGRTIPYTRGDTRNMRDQGKAMLGAGLRCPAILDHDKTAVPAYLSREEPRTRLARDGVGDVLDYRVSPGDGGLDGFFEIDDTPEVLRRVLRARYVSPRIDYDWRDEKGKRWSGLTISHVAWTPRPIQRHQDAVSLSHGAAGVPRIRGSHERSRDTHYLSHLEADDMADKPETPVAEETDLEAAPVAETPAPDGKGDVGELMDLLAACGVDLSDAAEHIASMDDLKLALRLYPKGGRPDGPDVGGGDATQPGGGMPPVLMSHAEQARWDGLARAEGRDLGRQIGDLFRDGRIDGPTRSRLLADLKAANLSHGSFDTATGALKPLPLLTKIEAYRALPKGKFAKPDPADLSHDTTPADAPEALAGTDPEAGPKRAAAWFESRAKAAAK